MRPTASARIVVSDATSDLSEVEERHERLLELDPDQLAIRVGQCGVVIVLVDGVGHGTSPLEMICCLKSTRGSALSTSSRFASVTSW
jgi:hypothetical protein